MTHIWTSLNWEKKIKIINLLFSFVLCMIYLFIWVYTLDNFRRQNTTPSRVLQERDGVRKNCCGRNHFSQRPASCVQNNSGYVYNNLKTWPTSRRGRNTEMVGRSWSIISDESILKSSTQATTGLGPPFFSATASAFICLYIYYYVHKNIKYNIITYAHASMHTDSSALHETAAEAFPVISCCTPAAAPPLMTTAHSKYTVTNAETGPVLIHAGKSPRRRRVKRIIIIIYEMTNTIIIISVGGKAAGGGRNARTARLFRSYSAAQKRLRIHAAVYSHNNGRLSFKRCIFCLQFIVYFIQNAF